MKDEFLNAIKIGENRWIKRVEISSDDYAKAENIDPCLTKNEEFWSLLESQCVAGCCGIDAFDFYPEEIASVASKFSGGRIRSEFIEAAEIIRNSDKTVFFSNRLNWYFSKSVLSELVDHIIESIKE